MNNIPKTDDLFDLGHTIAEALLEECEYGYMALSRIEDFILDVTSRLDRSYREIAKNVFIHESAKIWDNATLVGPVIIGKKAEIRPGAFLRGKVIVGDGAVIGNSTEIKNSIIFDEAKLPHYNYVGDSIIGYRAHLGAGAIASNLRLDKKTIQLGSDDKKLDTGLKKIGVMLGDYAEVGCGAILCPGSIVGREAVIYPLCRVFGIVNEKEIYKGKER